MAVRYEKGVSNLLAQVVPDVDGEMVPTPVPDSFVLAFAIFSTQPPPGVVRRKARQVASGCESYEPLDVYSEQYNIKIQVH